VTPLVSFKEGKRGGDSRGPTELRGGGREVLQTRLESDAYESGSRKKRWGQVYKVKKQCKGKTEGVITARGIALNGEKRSCYEGEKNGRGAFRKRDHTY